MAGKRNDVMEFTQIPSRKGLSQQEAGAVQNRKRLDRQRKKRYNIVI